MQISYEKNTVVIRVPVDPNGTYAPSKSGKTRMVANTGGFAAVTGGPEGLKVSLNVTLPPNQ